MGDTAAEGSGGESSVRMREGDTPLIDAARHGRADDVAALLSDGADVNETMANGSGRTALWPACMNGHAAIVTILVDAGADVDQADNEGDTPLYVACDNGHTEVVTILISAGAYPDRCGPPDYDEEEDNDVNNADVNHARNNGYTPLYIACQKGHTEVVAKLLAANAAVDQATNDGATPL